MELDLYTHPNQFSGFVSYTAAIVIIFNFSNFCIADLKNYHFHYSLQFVYNV